MHPSLAEPKRHPGTLYWMIQRRIYPPSIDDIDSSSYPEREEQKNFLSTEKEVDKLTE